MKRALRWSPDASADVKAIWDYYGEQADIDVADRLVDRIEARVFELIEYPELGVTCDHLWAGARLLTVSPHLVFYRVTSDDIEILRVIDGRRDRERAVDETES